MFHRSIPAIGPRSAMLVRKQTHGPGGNGLPWDFGERLDQFMQASGLGPRPLGRLLGVSPHRVREWRRGVVPSGRYLFRLLTLAEDMGMREMLTSPDPDIPSRPAEAKHGRGS